jgi:5-methylcytosine-specific restriction endonuclease McrA
VTREELFARDDRRCVYCGEIYPVEALTVDHVQPRSRGGDGSPGNLVTACAPCNTRKGGLRLAAFLLGDPVAHANFRRLAVHVWPRHLRALEEAITALARRHAGRNARPGDR